VSFFYISVYYNYVLLSDFCPSIFACVDLFYNTLYFDIITFEPGTVNDD